MEDLNKVFNELCHSRAAVTGVHLLMPKLCGINAGLTQSIKVYQLFTRAKHPKLRAV